MLNVVRVVFASTATVAMTYQFATLNVRPEYAKGDFFSFFTIQSNIIGVTALFALVEDRLRRRARAFGRAGDRICRRRGSSALAREPASEVAQPTLRISTVSLLATTMSETSSGGTIPWSTTPGSAESRSASRRGSSNEPV